MSDRCETCGFDAKQWYDSYNRATDEIQCLQARVAQLERRNEELEAAPLAQHVLNEDEMKHLRTRVVKLEAERAWWQERACRSNKHLHPDSYEKYLAVSCY
jgi:hypothetical protein